MSRVVGALPTVVSPCRCLTVWGGVTAVAFLLGAGCADTARALPRTLSGGTVDEAFVSLAAAVLLACSLWVWLVASATVVEVWRHGTATPARGVVRRLVLLACGAGLAAGLAAPATAVDERSPDPATTGVLEGLRLPERATAPVPGTVPGAGRTGARPVAAPAAAPARQVVVRPGDSLWRIAEQALPTGADVAEVDAAWRRLHARNREVVGPDPDLILPGQHLALPRHHDTDPAHHE